MFPLSCTWETLLQLLLPVGPQACRAWSDCCACCGVTLQTPSR